MLGRLQKGDDVVTRGGLIGRVAGISGKYLTLELQEKVRVRVLRSHIEDKVDLEALKNANGDSKADGDKKAA